MSTPLAMNLTVDSPSVQSYLQMLQGVINRMAANSSSCKTWCITIASAVIVIVADKAHPEYVWIAAGPIALFFFLDAYYLALEQHFRDLYTAFLKKLHAGEATAQDVFLLSRPTAGFIPGLRAKCSAAASASVWPFYLLVGLMLVAARTWILTVL